MRLDPSPRATPVILAVGRLHRASRCAGHRDTHLAFLARLKPGDTLIAERADGRRVTYRVSGTQVLDRREVWVTKQEGPVRLTLVTCYPFDAWRAGGSQRYVLVAFLS